MLGQQAGDGIGGSGTPPGIAERARLDPAHRSAALRAGLDVGAKHVVEESGPAGAF